MVSIKILITFFALLSFIEVFAASSNRTQEGGIFFETEDTNKNRTASHVSTDNKNLLDYASKLTNLLLLTRLISIPVFPSIQYLNLVLSEGISK